MIGGTVAIVGFLTVTTGALVAVQGYTDFSEIGVEALTGFASAFFNVRLIAPATTAVALSATIGAGATAQLGAMRINEEIDALEVMGIRSVAYLASTRVLAGVLVVIPLYCVGVLMAFLGGAVRHHRPLRPVDRRVRPLLPDVPEPHRPDLVVRPVHRDGGGDHAGAHLLRLHRAGGPAGVGEAVGRAVRTSLILAAFVLVMISLAVYGQSGNFNLAG